jgi:hypothetical protein
MNSGEKVFWKQNPAFWRIWNWERINQELLFIGWIKLLLIFYVQGSVYSSRYQIKELLLGLCWLKWNVRYFLMKVLLRIDVKIVVLFAFAKKLLFKFVLSFWEVFSVLKVFTSQLIHEIYIFLEEILYHLRQICWLF